MRLFYLILLLLAGSGISAQVVADKTTYNFGDLYKGSTTYADFVFTNKSQKVQYLLTIDEPRDVYYIFSGKKLEPDSSIVIRFKINDALKGRFTYDVDVYFSEPRDPIKISLQGTIREIAQNPLTACPDFDSDPRTVQPQTFDVVIRVIDSLSREPIKNARVYLVERGVLVGEHLTNSKGVVRKPFPTGLYYITAEKEGYASNFKESYLNFNRNYVEIELSRQQVVEEVTTILSEEEEIELFVDPEEVEQDTIAEVAITEEAVEVPAAETTALNELPDTLFDATHFKFNNITFILDVSTSMNSVGKLDMLKLTMIELVKILRPEDQVTLIKYASEVTTLMEHANGNQKEEIIEIVKNLRTSGLTAGGDAIKEAYRLNKKGYIPDGNNIVIMVTDGAFNKGDKDYLKTISNNYQSKGIRFSVVGIKTSQYLTAHMNNIVEQGGGAYVQIHDIEDAQKNLIDEIKRTSFKH